MLTNARTKLIKSLKLKKNRKHEGLFVVEGEKNVLELLDSDFSIHSLYATGDFLDTHARVLNRREIESFACNKKQLTNISSFKSNEQALSVVKIKKNQQLKADDNEFALILDEIKDPGNLGTIIRICDWYGINKIVASESTVDLYNPKVISASMGSFLRIQIYYCELFQFMQQNEGHYLGAYMKGSDVHSYSFGSGGYIVLGNESNGISESIAPFINQKISIPSYGSAESLNVGVAAAIILDNLKREH